MTIIPVKQFNKEAEVRYDKAVDNYEPSKGGFPFLPMYLFQTPEGENRQRGYVATSKDKHCFGINKEKAIAVFNNN